MSDSGKAKAEANKAIEKTEQGLISYATAWGESSLPPVALATFITALYCRPFKPLPLLFAPVLLFSSYLNLADFKADSAGLTAAWSGLYLLLASRRQTPGDNFGMRLRGRFGARGLTRGAAMGVAGVNVLGGGVVYALGRNKRKDRNQ